MLYALVSSLFLLVFVLPVSGKGPRFLPRLAALIHAGLTLHWEGGLYQFHLGGGWDDWFAG